MKYLLCKILLVLATSTQIISCTTNQAQPPPPTTSAIVIPLAARDPAELYGEFFERVQMAPVFVDSKYFVDMIPRETPAQILKTYHEKKPQTVEELRQFVGQHFLPPTGALTDFKTSPGETIDSHIKALWTYLKREPDQETQWGSSLIPLPYSYIVPGGRFREIYYWDSYFTQLGLLADHEDVTFQNMVKNFAQLSLSLGRIPNGNRNYYRGRSQPPFFSYMVALWQERYGAKSATQFLPALKQEYAFWMEGAENLVAGQGHARVVRLEDGVLNRDWDDKPAPRPESYKEDVALSAQAAKSLGRTPSDIYRDLRAGAESGWDYSTRWFQDPKEFTTIQTTALLPIDLNSLLYHLEIEISRLSRVVGDPAGSQKFHDLAETRQRLIQKYLWDEAHGVFRDYNWREGQLSSETTVATVVPLFAGVASPAQAQRIASVLEKDFLKAGGLVTTELTSGQQWDAPNGWPPHQWMAYAGLKRYGFNKLAEKIRDRWLKLNRKVFNSTGKLMEKYNVVDLSLKSGGGEYPLQDGFGWTNGVYRALSTPKESLKHLKE